MKAIKHIPRPEFTSARRLTPLEMNNIHCLRQHTVLTAEQINRIAPNSEKSD